MAFGRGLLSPRTLLISMKMLLLINKISNMHGLCVKIKHTNTVKQAQNGITQGDMEMVTVQCIIIASTRHMTLSCIICVSSQFSLISS